MPFGVYKSTRREVSSQSQPKDSIFLNMRDEGNRLVRPFSEEQCYTEYWVAREPSGENAGRWVPTFGYDPTDRRERRPIIMSVMRVDSEGNRTWEGTRDNPIERYWDALVDSGDLTIEERRKIYAKQHMQINVMDLTQVKIDGDGNIVYPDIRNRYPDSLKEIPAAPRRKICIMRGTSGKLLDDDDQLTGNHFHANLAKAVIGITNQEGDPESPLLFTLRINIAGRGKDVRRTVSPTADYSPMDYENIQIYDLEGWLKPYPNAFIQDLLDGSDYNEAIKRHGIKLYPDLKPYLDLYPNPLKPASDESLF